MAYGGTRRSQGRRPNNRFRQALRLGVNFAGRMAGSYVRQRFTKRSPETGITAQYDRVTQYSKKSMPRRKKRAWKKFSQKVNAVLEKTLGTRTVIFNDAIGAQAVAGVQSFASACLYGYCGASDSGATCGNRDIYTICNNDNDIMTATSAGTNASKIQFKSAVIDLTMRNNGTTPIEVDVYEINVMTDETKETSFVTSAATANTVTNVIPNAWSNTGISLANRGVTLFDLPNLISMDKLKIYKKRKYFLPPGNTSTLQHRDPRNHTFNATDLPINSSEAGSYGKRKFTQMYVFVAKEIVGSISDVGTNLTVGVTRKYSYIINQSSKALDTYNPLGP